MRTAARKRKSTRERSGTLRSSLWARSEDQTIQPVICHRAFRRIVLDCPWRAPGRYGAYGVARGSDEDGYACADVASATDAHKYSTGGYLSNDESPYFAGRPPTYRSSRGNRFVTWFVISHAFNFAGLSHIVVSLRRKRIYVLLLRWIGECICILILRVAPITIYGSVREIHNRLFKYFKLIGQYLNDRVRQTIWRPLDCIWRWWFNLNDHIITGLLTIWIFYCSLFWRCDVKMYATENNIAIMFRLASL